ncbi:MAG: Hsp70 family protein, partial [Elusimicrobiota bacterium]|nr:Hsp70 family protein [Elusimicrobiota bacterium]
KFVKQAEQFADADKQYKEKVETKNEADTVLYTTEKALKEHGDKISPDERLAVDRAIGEMKDAIKGDDMEKVKKAKDALIQVSQKLGEAVYKAAQAKAGPGAAGAGPAPEGAKASAGGKEDIVDAEVVDEKKK